MSSTEKSRFELCLGPLLKALDYHGGQQPIHEALPHLQTIHSSLEFGEVMRHLNFTMERIDIKLNQFDSRLLPCLFVSHCGDVLVLMSEKNGKFRVYDSEYQDEIELSIGSLTEAINPGKAYVFMRQPTSEPSIRSDFEKDWFRKKFRRNKDVIYTAVFLSLVINLLGLATPLFIMSVYDKVVAASSLSMLGQFSMGVLIALIGISFLYRLRGQFLAVAGARLDRDIGNSILERLLYLAPIYTESTSVSNQVSRLKDFDRLREFFTGPRLVVFFDLPFIFIALIIIAILSGWLVIMPIVMVLCYLLLALYTKSKVKWVIKDSAKSGTSFQEFLLESIYHIRAIKYTGSDLIWADRFREISANSTLMNIKQTMIAAVNHALSKFIMTSSGMIVLAFGAIRIIDGSLTVGGLLATMILIWRILSPISAIYNLLPRFEQVINGFTQIGRLMKISPESRPHELAGHKLPQFKGDITFNRVSMRYEGAYAPSLVGVNFHIKAGSLVGIVGSNASGKSTILKMILDLYPPQAGNILIDGHDIRQLNPVELRSAMGYMSQQNELFYGTIAANLRLAKPRASNEELREATQKAGIFQKIIQLPDGFETRIKDQTTYRLSRSFRQGLSLARVYLKDASIYLFDEPGSAFNFEQDKRFMKNLQMMRGKKTVLLVSHRPSHLNIMDKLLVFNQGQLVMAGPPSEVLEKIPPQFL